MDSKFSKYAPFIRCLSKELDLYRSSIKRYDTVPVPVEIRQALRSYDLALLLLECLIRVLLLLLLSACEVPKEHRRP